MVRFVALALCVFFSWAALSLDTPHSSAAADESPFGDSKASDAAQPDPDTLFSAAPTTPKDTANRLVDPTPRLEIKIREALGHPTKMEFIETPLREVVAYLKDLHGIEIHLHNKALREAGIDPDQVITVNTSGNSLRSSLRLLLEAIDLTFVVRDGMLLITSQEAAEKMVELRVYDVGNLIRADGDAGEVAEKLQAIYTCNFKVVSFRNLLIVQAPQHVHEELADLLDQIQAKLPATN